MTLQAQVESILSAAVTAPHGPAGIVFGAIDRAGKMLVQSAAGVKELGKEGQMSTDSVFCIFSCTKVRHFQLPRNLGGTS